jgi:hypothetical protein
LDVAARGCGGRGLYANSIVGRSGVSRAETVLQDTTHDTVRAEIEYGEKVSRRLWLKKLEEEIALKARHRDTERREGHRVFELESEFMLQR